MDLTPTANKSHAPSNLLEAATQRLVDALAHP